MIDRLRRVGISLPLGAVVLTAVTACSVPTVGEIAISRLADGTFVAHVRICDGAGPIDGLTMYDDDRFDQTLHPEEGVTDRTSWPIGPIEERTAAMGADDVDGPISVYGWTRENTESLVGPDGGVSTWEGLGPTDLMYLDWPPGDDRTVLVTTISNDVSVDEWYADACDD